jgi:hypothetical protein
MKYYLISTLHNVYYNKNEGIFTFPKQNQWEPLTNTSVLEHIKSKTVAKFFKTLEQAEQYAKQHTIKWTPKIFSTNTNNNSFSSLSFVIEITAEFIDLTKPSELKKITEKTKLISSSKISEKLLDDEIFTKDLDLTKAKVLTELPKSNVDNNENVNIQGTCLVM